MKNVVSRARVKRAPSNALCLSVDRLNADCLGAYGAAWINTPTFDRLAVESVLFDSCFATSLDLRALCRAWWRGERPVDFCVDDRASARASIFRAYKERGYRVFLVSDVESVALHSCVEDDCCDGRFFLNSSSSTTPSETLEETAFFKNFEELAKFILKLDEEDRLGAPQPWFVWAHFSGWNERWDWPIELRREYQESEDDPEPYAAVLPPFWPAVPRVDAHKRARDAETSAARAVCARSDDDDDETTANERARLDALDAPDRRQSVFEAYCGGIEAFDATLAGFLDLLQERNILKKTLFMTVGARGCGLGAPSQLGVPASDCDASPFYSEEIRVPLVFRLPDGLGAATRLATLCEPRDLFETLRAWPDFARDLASEDFWKIENVEISPFAGAWFDDDAKDPAAPTARSRDGDASPIDAHGQNLLRFLRDEDGAARNCVVATRCDARSQERALIVKDWFFKTSPMSSSEIADDDPDASTVRRELFVLPDDRFCVNDVADRRRDDVDYLASALERLSMRVDSQGERDEED